MKSTRTILSILIVCLLFNCKEDPSGKEDNQESQPIQDTEKEEQVSALFEYLDPSQTNIDFKNQVLETESFNFLLYEYLYNGGGVAIGDINNDGLDDIYFTGNTVTNRLYLNEGDFKFRDITQSAMVNGGQGYKTGVTMADVNNDGFLDIYVCKSAFNNPEPRRNVLYINNGDLTFTEKAEALGLDDAGFSVQAYFFDSDGDKDLDVFVLNHPSDMRESNSIKVTKDENGNLVRVKPTEFEHIANRLYENRNGKFYDVSDRAGVLDNTFSLSAVVGDFNNDFKPDIYVCNDYMKPDRLFINQGNNKFKDQIDDYFSHTSFSSMGSDFADINNDSNLDLFTLDMSPKKNDRRKMMMMAQNYDKFEKMFSYGFGTQYSVNALQLNTGSNYFTDIAFLDNLAQTEWSWSALFADFDNDGLKDLHITNGYKRDVTNNDYSRYEMDELQKKLNTKQITLTQWIQEIPSIPVSAFLFQNQGQNRFKDVSIAWDSGLPSFSNGSAYSDLNNDGFLDLVVSNINEAPFIMKNNGAEQSKNQWLSVDFEHNKGALITGTIGKLTLSDGSVITEQYNPTRGFLSSSQHRLHFGLKEGLTATKLEIIWPDKTIQTIENPQVNSRLVVSKSSTNKYELSETASTLFSDLSSKLGKGFSHEENEFIDFKREILLHRKYSEEGPAAAIADVNNDGLEDVFLGGANGYPAKLFLQSNSGGFQLKTVQDFENDKSYEDTDAVFFDANGDGIADLYVVSGGNEYEVNSKEYKDRLYINDGSGNFSNQSVNLPNLYRSGSTVTVHDIDADGDLDIFVGNRVTPGRYPELPKCFVLQNNNGEFKDMSSTWFKSVNNSGMITDAEFADLNNDGSKELIIAGEWMPITVYKYSNGSFTDVTENFGLQNYKGWWNTVTIDDLDGDGFMDIVAGNLGLNSIFKASELEPTTLYYKDFDQNGSVDPVLCTHIEGVSYPIHNRDRMLNHMVMLKKRFIRYKPYSYATINDIFTPQELMNVNVLKANHFEHTIFMNSGGTSFKAEPLPLETQVSVVNSIVTFDVNKDGKKDLISVGNFFGTDAEFGRYDASIGQLILNKSSGLEAVPASKSGISIPGNVQDMKPLTIGSDQYFLVVRNNDDCSLIKYNL